MTNAALRRTPLGLVIALGLLGPAHGRIAAASTVATVNVDHIAITPSGRHRVWVSVLEDDGGPRTGLSPQSFAVSEDLQPVKDLSVQPYTDRYRRSDVTLIVDPDLASEVASGALRSWIRTVQSRIGPDDRLRLVKAGEGFPSIELSGGSDASGLEGRLKTITAASAPLPFDAVFREIRRARQTSGNRGTIILVATRGVDGGSRNGALEILALLRATNRPATISVFVWSGAEESRDISRLNRLTQDSGGISRRVASTDALEQASIQAVERTRGAYLLGFRPSDWHRWVDRHQLRVTVREEDARRTVETEFATDDVMETPWWSHGQTWMGVGALVLILAATAYLLRPRCIARLVVETGDERGCRYEIFQLPVTFGAATGNDILLAESHVSRNHAILDRRGRALELQDLNSENGTFVNGSRVTRQLLVPGDTITFAGAVSMTYRTPGRFRGAK